MGIRELGVSSSPPQRNVWAHTRTTPSTPRGGYGKEPMPAQPLRPGLLQSCPPQPLREESGER